MARIRHLERFLQPTVSSAQREDTGSSLFCVFVLVVADAKKCLVCLLLVLFILCFEVLVVLFFDLPFHCFSVAGVVSKVVNHVNEFASTDALCLWDDLLLSSSFDLDHGSGYINGELAF